jgi:hypothetical protein
VQHGAALGHVDRRAGEHGVAPLGHARRLGDGQQLAEDRAVDLLLGQIHAQAADVVNEVGGALRVGGEQRAEVRWPPAQVHQPAPRRRLGDVDRGRELVSHRRRH